MRILLALTALCLTGCCSTVDLKPSAPGTASFERLQMSGPLVWRPAQLEPRIPVSTEGLHDLFGYLNERANEAYSGTRSVDLRQFYRALLHDAVADRAVVTEEDVQALRWAERALLVSPPVFECLDHWFCRGELTRRPSYNWLWYRYRMGMIATLTDRARACANMSTKPLCAQLQDELTAYKTEVETNWRFKQIDDALRVHSAIVENNPQSDLADALDQFDAMPADSFAGSDDLGSAWQWLSTAPTASEMPQLAGVVSAGFRNAHVREIAPSWIDVSYLQRQEFHFDKPHIPEGLETDGIAIPKFVLYSADEEAGGKTFCLLGFVYQKWQLE
jgi:hypothetical protein